MFELAGFGVGREVGRGIGGRGKVVGRSSLADVAQGSYKGLRTKRRIQVSK